MTIPLRRDYAVISRGSLFGTYEVDYIGLGWSYWWQDPLLYNINKKSIEIRIEASYIAIL